MRADDPLRFTRGQSVAIKRALYSSRDIEHHGQALMNFLRRSGSPRVSVED